jgi:hypothetical protein
MEGSTTKTLGLLAGGAVLGVLVMKWSMQRGQHVKLGKNLLATGSGIVVGATMMHFAGEKEMSE